MASESSVLVGGSASGEALVLDEPISFWGGIDPQTGDIIDGHHPQAGRVISGRVLVMPYGRGSSSASAVLAEAIRLGTAPAAVVMREADPIVMIGSLVAEELYGLTCPVIVIPTDYYNRIATGDRIEIEADGTLRLTVDG